LITPVLLRFVAFGVALGFAFVSEKFLLGSSAVAELRSKALWLAVPILVRRSQSF
jgi:hypothetical protein